MLEENADCSGYEFITGAPSTLNSLLREGGIDVSPSSSIEYLRRRQRYIVIEGHSISSFGPVGSILLFSKRPIEALDGLTVLTSSQSETSAALLGIVLKKFYDLDCPLQPSNEPLSKAMESHSAYLLIGDEALREGLRWSNLLHVYDLGEIWYKKTGLPFVFALWIARKDCCTGERLFERFKKDLDTAKLQMLKGLRAIAGKSPLLPILTEDQIVSYWQGISYDLNDEHRKGLSLFGKYAGELSLL